MKGFHLRWVESCAQGPGILNLEKLASARSRCANSNYREPVSAAVVVVGRDSDAVVVVVGPEVVGPEAVALPAVGLEAEAVAGLEAVAAVGLEAVPGVRAFHAHVRDARARACAQARVVWARARAASAQARASARACARALACARAWASDLRVSFLVRAPLCSISCQELHGLD